LESQKHFVAHGDVTNMHYNLFEIISFLYFVIFLFIPLVMLVYRHIRLLRGLDRYMFAKHAREWKKIKHKTFLLEFPPLLPFDWYSYRALWFIFFSRENFNDKNIDRMRSKLQLSVVYIIFTPIFFFVLSVCVFLIGGYLSDPSGFSKEWSRFLG